MDSDFLLDCLHVLISNNVISDDAYISRYKGFNAELDFLRFYERNKTTSSLYSGGYLLPTIKGQSALVDPVYFTVSSSDPASYVHIYEAISRLQCKKLFYIRFDDSTGITNWQMHDVMGIGVPIPVPLFIVYEFCSSEIVFKLSDLNSLTSLYSSSSFDKNFFANKDFYKGLLSGYPYSDLLQLYVSRLIFDGYIGLRCSRGVPSDIDGVLEAKGELILLEIKEKDLSKKPPVGFGMDVKRINALDQITKKTGLRYTYCVRQVDNQVDRNFVAWRYINMAKFINCLGDNVVNGKHGMGFLGGEYPTRICPVEFFNEKKGI